MPAVYVPSEMTDPPTGTNQSYVRQLLAAIMWPGWLDKTLNRLRGTVIIESGTVTTVTGVTNLDGYQAKLVPIGTLYTAWHQLVRSRIS